MNSNKDEPGFTLINTNARSLCPKINSLLDCFEEMNVDVAVVTETWLSDGESLQDDISDLSHGAGLGMICKNRPVNNRGFSHGGVAIMYQTGTSNFTRVDLPNPGDFEVIVGAGSLPGHSRKMVVVACYLPPGYDVPKGKRALDYITDVVLEIKRKYRDPYLVVTGDFNQWDIAGALEDYQDICLLYTSPSPRD